MDIAHEQDGIFALKFCDDCDARIFVRLKEIVAEMIGVFEVEDR